MRKRLVYIAVILCMIISLVPIAMSAPAVEAATLYVGPGETYTTIQAAINAAADYDTIIVRDGVYTNANLIINKPLTIISENGSDSTTIQGGGSGNAVSIDVSNVTFGGTNQGFTVTFGSCPGIAMYPDSGTEMTGVSIIGNVIHDCSTAIDFAHIGAGNYDFHDNTITGNLIYDCSYGISLTNWAENGDMYGNIIAGNTVRDYTATGIALQNRDAGDIRSNNVSANTLYNASGWFEFNIDGIGIYLQNLQNSGNISDNEVTGNEVYNCSDYGIFFENFECTGSIINNTVSENTVYECEYGIELKEYDTDGDVCQNTVEDNTVYDCGGGIGLVSEYDKSVHDNTIDGNDIDRCTYWGIYLISKMGGVLYDNEVTGNDIYDCYISDYGGAGIYVESADYGSVSYGNTIDGNDVGNCMDGIVVRSDEDGIIYNTAVTNNTVYWVDYVFRESGIYFDVYYTGGLINDSTIEGNTVYGWTYGIYLNDEYVTTIDDIDILDNVLYNESDETGNDYGIRTDNCGNISISGNDIQYSSVKGVCIVNSDYIDITSNTVHYNDAGIYMEDSSYIEIRGNDIRDNNFPNLTGIQVYGSEYVFANCNNIAGNGVGLYVYDPLDPMTCVNANDNWWGNGSGPSGYQWEGSGDEIMVSGAGCVTAQSWLEEEFDLSSTSTPLNAAAVPAVISLYDAMDMYCDLYSQGPAYTDIIVEFNCSDTPCGVPTVNLSSLLLDMLPADFETTHVATWSESWQEYWQWWLDYLSDTKTNIFYEVNGSCLYDYELWLEDLFFEDDDCMDECYEEFCPECAGLSTFLQQEYDPEDDCCEGYEQTYRMIIQEMNRGEFLVPVEFGTCSGTTTVYAPLTVVDFQIPIEEGPNLRSTPVRLDQDWDTLADIMGDSLDDVAAFIGWDSAMGEWVELGPETVFTPLTAYYIIMENGSIAQMRFVVEHAITIPPTRTLQAGWNLAAPAPAYGYEPGGWEGSWPDCYPFPAMSPWDALYSVVQTPGELPGWYRAVVPEVFVEYQEYFYYGDIELDKAWYWKWFDQWNWEVYVDGEFDGEFVTPGGGYWVFLNNSDVLAGYSYTPVPWTMAID